MSHWGRFFTRHFVAFGTDVKKLKISICKKSLNEKLNAIL